VHEAAGDARDEEAVVDLQFYGVLEGLLGYAEHAVELLGLRYCAGEAVEDESLGALGVVLELRLDHVDHDLVANQTTRVHDLLCFPAERSLCRDLRAQHVSGSKMASAELLLDLGRLSTLASTGRTHQDHPDALRRRRRTPILTRESLFQVSDALLKAGDGALEVIDRRIC